MKLRKKLEKILNLLPNKIKIGKQYIGVGCPVFIIAEVGINHNGDIGVARKLIDAACDAGADAVKFQKREISEILTKDGRDRVYSSVHAYGNTYGEHRKKLELSVHDYVDLKKYCEKKGILFFASVWDEKSADHLEKLQVDAYKIPSADLINLPLLEYVAQKNKPVLISTGMNSEEEINDAVDAILKYNNKLVIFHCLSLYPSPEEKINLRCMNVLMKDYYPLPVGYSGHEMEYLPTIAAVAMGATIIERHLTLDKTMKGSDHAASLEPAQFKKLVDDIRQVERILGSSKRVIADEVKPLREKLAKSVATREAIKKGQVIKREMLVLKGPGTGIEPSKMDLLVGKIAKSDILEDTLVPNEAVDW